MMKYRPTDEDLEYFRTVVKDIKPLKPQNRVQAIKQKPASRRSVGSAQADHSVVDDFLSDHLTTSIVDSNAQLFFATSGLQHKTIRDLRQGKITPVDSVDLHRLTVTEARQVVTQFLTNSLEAGYRCVRIIHGKGELNREAPILKNQVNNWLRQFPDVLAFCSAPPRDGGVGAVYVLLRRGG